MSLEKKITPKGFFPVLSRWIGSLWVLYFAFGGIYAVYLAWQNGVVQYTLFEFLYKVFASIAGVLLFVLPFSLPGLLIAGLFPSIQIDKHGIRYGSLFLGGLTKWNEIQTIAKVRRPTECLAVVISRPFGLINGLWFSTMYGRLTGIRKPVLLISMNWEDRDELLQEISITTRFHITTRLRFLLRDFAFGKIRSSFLQARTSPLCMGAVGSVIAGLTIVQNGREIGEANNFVADRTCHELPSLRCGERRAFF